MTAKFTIESLSAEIESTHKAFKRLNDARKHILRSVPFKGFVTHYFYGTLSQSEERTLTRLAERIDRLYRFRAMLAAKKLTCTP